MDGCSHIGFGTISSVAPLSRNAFTSAAFLCFVSAFLARFFHRYAAISAPTMTINGTAIPAAVPPLPDPPLLLLFCPRPTPSRGVVDVMVVVEMLVMVAVVIVVVVAVVAVVVVVAA